MKLPEVENPGKYVGLYVVDFGEHTGLGFTAREVAELLESEKFRDVTVYKIYNAYPDGRMEIKGVRRDIFELETGMFFYSQDEVTAERDYKELVEAALAAAPPERAKVHLAKYGENSYVTALIYPAEYNEEFSRWLLERDYKTAGAAEGGIEAVQRYYDQGAEVLRRHQLFGETGFPSRTGEELLVATKVAVQR